MTQRIVNVDSVEFVAPFPPNPKYPRFESRLAQIGATLGAQKLGYNVTAIPPGKVAFPFHNHRVNEEMFYVIAGRGEVRMGDQRHPIRSGDVIACPPGGPEAAHQIVNTGDEELRFLAVSTKLSPEICEYPDSNKFGVRADFGKDAEGKPQSFSFLGRTEATLDYWDGE